MAGKNPIKAQSDIAAKAMKSQRLAAKQKQESELASIQLAGIPDMTPGEVARVGNPVQVIEQVPVPSKAKRDKMDEDEVNSYVSRAIESALSWNNDQATYRAIAQQAYDAVPTGDLKGSGVAGRSEFVSSDVSDVVEAAMPMLMETFLASGSIVEFGAKKPSDEEAAAQTSDLANFIVLEQNEGYKIFSEWFRDALINRFGVVAVRYEEADREREEYEGITDVQLGILLDDPEVELVDLVQFPDPDALRDAEHAQMAQQQAYDAFMQATGTANRRE